ncbi:hypothetical protein LTR56_000429 [Elasticomyces elasticus]|nr:hypothetical protein LTR56_000429 [Elasticomyces elasticus]KAK3666876.1 hypothetical protein LTR22_002101 [Elasticomyces elasticus]KAK4933423.1 hypothetical protein LTR49_000417 [Elasticomyces elasticus]KAK5751174.1 hypothetical protein LTS12_018726 [Elasticomyces elasticus]
MAPRKKAKTSLTASPTPVSNPQTPAEADNASPASDCELWTDEEELGLFKGLMTWKPTGIHKHFRLLALHHFLLSNHYIHPRNEHTKPAGLWRKLNTLYDLEALDEREDARQLSDLSLEDEDQERGDGESDAYSEAENKIHRLEFELPQENGGEGEGYGEMMWRRRFVDGGGEGRGGSESPAALPELNRVEEMPVRFTPSFSVEPSEAPTPSGRAGRAKAAVKKKGKVAQAAPTTNSRRSARQAGSVAGDEEEEEDGDEDESESRDGEGSTRSTPAISAKTAAGKTKARGNANVKAKGKGRTRVR